MLFKKRKEKVNVTLLKKMLQFAQLNKENWSEDSTSNKSKILVYISGNPITPLVETMVFAKKIAEKENKEIVIATEGNISDCIKEVYLSFNVNGFVDLNKCSIIKKIKYIIKAFIIYLKIFSGKELLDLKYNNIPIGEDLYDDILRKNPRLYSISNLKFKFILNIYTIFKKMYCSENLMNSEEFNTLIFTDCDYDRSAITKIAILNDCNIYQVNNGYIIKHEEKKFFKLKVVNQLINSEYNKYEIINHELVSKYLDSYFLGEDETILDKHAFLNKKNYTKESLDYTLGVENTSLKNVLVAAHAFSDRSHYGYNMIYQDYYQWLIETLKILSKNKEVNVFVKEHPSSKFYGEEGSIRNIISRENIKNVYLIPEDFNNKNSFDIMDYIVTCQGTIGIEGACFGIPVFTASQGYYYGFGIDYNAKNIFEYEEYLKNITKYNRLDVEFQNKAKILLYMVGKICNEKVLDILPQHRFRDNLKNLLSEEYQYSFIINEMLKGKKVKGNYYDNILGEIIIQED